jgi:hypothetical protein
MDRCGAENEINRSEGIEFADDNGVPDVRLHPKPSGKGKVKRRPCTNSISASRCHTAHRAAGSTHRPRVCCDCKAS